MQSTLKQDSPTPHMHADVPPQHVCRPTNHLKDEDVICIRDQTWILEFHLSLLTFRVTCDKDTYTPATGVRLVCGTAAVDAFVAERDIDTRMTSVNCRRLAVYLRHERESKTRSQTTAQQLSVFSRSSNIGGRDRGSMYMYPKVPFRSRFRILGWVLSSHASPIMGMQGSDVRFFSCCAGDPEIPVKKFAAGSRGPCWLLRRSPTGYNR
jgi:hypothetical protein